MHEVVKGVWPVGAPQFGWVVKAGDVVRVKQVVSVEGRQYGYVVAGRSCGYVPVSCMKAV